MKEIGKRLWREPVFLGTVLITLVGLGSAALGWDGATVGGVTAAIAVITGATVRQRVSPS